MSPKDRESHLLKGLVVTCGVISHMESWREYCPETTTEFLEKEGGKGFLDLIETICPKDITQIKLRSSPIFLSHPVFDATYHIGEPCPPEENEAVREVVQQQISMARNSFLSYFLWHTLLGIYGISEEYRALRPSVKSEKLTLEASRGVNPGRLRAIKQEYKDDYKAAERVCANCHKPKSKLPAGKSLMECPKCRAVGRVARYCDKYELSAHLCGCIN